MLALLTSSRPAMTWPGSGSPAPSRMARAWNALADSPCASRAGRSISVTSASWARARFTATSLADRLAPGNSRSKSAGIRMVEISVIAAF